MSDDDAFDSASNAVAALADNADRLGLTWSIRPATVQSYDVDTNKATAIYDGDEEAISMVSLAGCLLPDFRVMAMFVPPAANFILSTLGVPKPGELVIRLRQDSGGQSIPDGTSTFVTFDTVDHNLFGTGFSTGENTKYIPKVPGWYYFSGRIVYPVNATSRRSAFLNENGTTSGTGSFGGTSLQAPAAGTAQVQCAGAVFLNGTTDYVGLRALHNAGVALVLGNTDGGSTLEGYYVGATLPRG